jgi:hypothetical protein
MNQEQRKYLLEQVNRTYQREKRALDDRRPDPPSLNNYLIACVLDGSFQLQEPGDIRAHVRSLVLDLGAAKTFIDTNNYRYNSNKDEDENEQFVSLRADALFVLPENYREAKAAYDEARAAWDKESEQLEEFTETVKLKIQIGSSKALDKLVEQADNLADLNIVNTKLLLTASDEPKRLKE